MAADMDAGPATTSTNPADTTDTSNKRNRLRQQLTAGMEHMRAYVTVPETPNIAPDASISQDAYGVPAAYEPVRKPTNTPSSNENPEKRSDPFQFGTRFLGEDDDIFAHNAWDHVDVEPQYREFIATQTAFQREHGVTDFDKHRFNDKPEKWWDRFYSNNAANFFKDRKWLVQEFPVLAEVTKEGYGPCTILEVGAGAGNTAFPLLARNTNPEFRLHACDYSSKAIDVIRAQPAYDEQQEPKVLQADVWDAAGQELPPGLSQGSVDIIIMIFIFSALEPRQWQQALRNAHSLLKPGGQILFRDYGRGDLAQVRFKKGRYLEENFYVRGDGTRVYFFDEEELRDIWSNNEDSAARFEVVELATDRRMLVNRQRKIKMYRCWMQGRFRKAGVAAEATTEETTDAKTNTG